MWVMRYVFIENLIQLTNFQKNVVVMTLAFISIQYVLVLCNSIGTPLDSKYIDVGKQLAVVLSVCCLFFLDFIMNFLCKSVVQ